MLNYTFLDPMEVIKLWPCLWEELRRWFSVAVQYKVKMGIRMSVSNKTVANQVCVPLKP